MTFQPTFGRYLLLKRIAKGGMAEIFRAMSYGSAGFKRMVAIKRMLPHLTSDQQFVDLFINEARVVSNLNHDNIVRMYEFGCIDEMLFHSMEYIHGVNLGEIVDALQTRQQAMPVELACFLIKEALYGLSHAHEQRDGQGQGLNIIHRDLSPANILVSYEGAVKLADFGIAKATMTRTHTAVGMVRGKARYLSPEQAEGKSLDQRTDLFSLGICFYELLTLKPMFEEQEEIKLLKKVKDADFIKPRKINPDIPPDLEAILLKALKRRPSGRYSTAGAWRDTLEKFMFDHRMHASGSTLAAFMGVIFRRFIEAEQEHLAEELERADLYQPDPKLLDPARQDRPSLVDTLPLDRNAVPSHAILENHPTPYLLPRFESWMKQRGQSAADLSTTLEEKVAPLDEVPSTEKSTAPELPQTVPPAGGEDLVPTAETDKEAATEGKVGEPPNASQMNLTTLRDVNLSGLEPAPPKTPPASEEPEEPQDTPFQARSTLTVMPRIVDDDDKKKD